MKNRSGEKIKMPTLDELMGFQVKKTQTNLKLTEYIILRTILLK